MQIVANVVPASSVRSDLLIARSFPEPSKPRRGGMSLPMSLLTELGALGVVGSINISPLWGLGGCSGEIKPNDPRD